MKEEQVRTVRSLTYIISVLWAAYLILISYQQNGDLITAFVTILVMLGSMILNDLTRN